MNSISYFKDRYCKNCNSNNVCKQSNIEMTTCLLKKIHEANETIKTLETQE